METLGKFKTNFFKNKNSFNIGFNNRSPLSKLDGSIPTQSREAVELSPSVATNMRPLDNSRLLESQEGVSQAIADVGAKIGKAIDERKFAKRVTNLPQLYSDWTGTQEDFDKKYAKEIEVFKKGVKAGTIKNPGVIS